MDIEHVYRVRVQHENERELKLLRVDRKLTIGICKIDDIRIRGPHLDEQRKQVRKFEANE